MRNVRKGYVNNGEINKNELIRRIQYIKAESLSSSNYSICVAGV